MSTPISREQAEATLAAVKAQFAAYLTGDIDPPVLCEPFTQITFHWSIAWEDGPEGWAYRAFIGGLDEELYDLAREAGADPRRATAIATSGPASRPAGVAPEPYYGWLLGLYPALMCQAHPAFEADYCPGCGTAAKIPTT